MTHEEFRKAERAAHEAGEKTLRYYIESSHDFSIEYMAMGVVQDAVRAFREAANIEVK